MKLSRRAFIETTTSAGLVIPAVGSQVLLGCTTDADDPAAVPSSRPADWDPVDFNVARGRAGLIPADYMEQIEGTDGIAKHLGKHLPYVPELAEVDAGWIPIMWGDPAAGYSPHPNAPQSAANPEGHWYDWIRVAIDGEPASEIESTYDG